jgi:hypothetical protein
MNRNNNNQGYRNNSKLKLPGVEMQYTKEEFEEYVKCANDPVYFCEKYIKVKTLDKGVVPFKLYPYQKKFINELHKNRFVISKWPRQCGKSTCVTSYICHYVTFNQSVNVAILANRLKTAKEELFSKLQLAYENLPHFLQQGVVEWNKTSFKLENGSRVMCDATSSTAIRGGSYNLLLLDEYAFLPSHVAEEFYTSTYPTISAGTTTKLIIVSTPNGMNHFHKLWVDANRNQGHKLKNMFVPVEVSWRETPISPGSPKLRDDEWATEQIANTSPEQFEQEYGCSFLGSSNTLISTSKLNVLAPEEYLEEDKEGLRVFAKPEKDQIYFLQADVSRGQGSDFSAFTLIDGSSAPYKVVATFRNNTISPFNFPTIIKKICEQYNNAYALIETNDIGGQVSSILYNDLGYENVLMTRMMGRKGQILSQGFASSGRSEMGLRTTTQTKKLGCAILKRLIEEDKILLNDERIISELFTFVSKANTYKAEEGHNDDLVMSLVFFAWLSRQEYYADLIESAKFNYEDAQKPEDDNVLFMMDNKDELDDREPFSQGGVVWYPT